MVCDTESARACTRRAASVVSTGKKESSAEIRRAFGDAEAVVAIRSRCRPLQQSPQPDPVALLDEMNAKACWPYQALPLCGVGRGDRCAAVLF